MIQINLVPDVKQQLISAQRTRTTVITLSVIIAAAAAAVVVLVAIYVYGGQTLRSVLVDKSIASEQKKLEAVPDLAKTLTVQNQLTHIDETHNNKHLSSRLFDVLATINPAAPNNVTVSNVSLNSQDKIISIEAQAARGYSALEIFKKTVEKTELEYRTDNEAVTEPLASDITVTDASYGEDSSGKKVLRFTLSFTYAEELFMPSSEHLKVVGPVKQNVTDSYTQMPASLFGDKAKDIEEDE